MRPSNSLIALGIGTAIAVSAAPSPTQAAPLASHSHVRFDVSLVEKPLVPAADAIAQAEVKATSPLTVQNIEPKPSTLAAKQTAPSTQNNDPKLEQTEPPPAESTETGAPEATPDRPQEPSSTVAPESPSESSSSASTQRTINDPAPEYLNPDPNPLSFPTTPEEVQIVGTQPITLRQAIDLAIRNSRTLQQSRLELERNQASLREAESRNSLTVGLQGGLAFQANEEPNVTPPTTIGGSTGFDGTTLQNSTTLNGTVSANYNLFTAGGRSATIAAARGQVQSQQLQLEADTEQLILDVTNNYYDLQEADEQVRITQTSLTEAQRSLRDAQALERAGVGTRFDVLQAEVDVANAQQNLTQQISQQEIERRQIVQQLSLSQSVSVAAADPIDIAGQWDLSLEETIVLAFKNRAELEQQLVQREIFQQNRRQALSQLEPQVNLSASYGVSRVLDNPVGASTTYNGFLSTFQAQVGVNWNLFDGGAARAQADQQEANIALAENQFASNREQIRFQVEQAYSTLRSSFDNIQVTSLAVQRAAEALRLARLRFQAGVGTQTDVLQQQTALTRAEVNRLTAILNYNRALASLRRQVSNYPEGNLADTP